ncbi:PepSY-associated TM helix domain-containing protein [Flavobacterium agrisoli]|uniref:PepSY domain-containing protein n=1 Tax=Flavobacterium agrisoli TaxID=2793066 RepID=A0A934PLW7_9FLAO|nr:PepSY-associated TM helix domain-containing protein [Flavobacterium agrisoli]MBK0369244.1 PepSY domain-containing protein [Flavobacterium agrisoli]
METASLSITKPIPPKKTRPNKNPKTKSRGSKLNAWLHLWLGLSSGIIVFIVSLTGVIFVFCDDIIDIISYKAWYVPDIKEQRLSPEELITHFKEQFPERTPFSYIHYRDPERTVKIASETENREFQFSWMDPYTGKILDSNQAYDFFYVIAHIHSGHIPFGAIGNLIVEIAVWLFFIELITGLILWWPKKWNKTTRKQSFTIKTGSSFKRLNYDLHNVPGFYSLIPALLITITGLIIVNKPLQKSTHHIFDGTPAAFRKIRELAPEYDKTKKWTSIQPIITDLFKKNASAEQVKMSIPEKDSATTYMAIAAKNIGLKGLHDGKVYLINRYDGNAIPIPNKLLNGLSIDNTNMNLHIGFWYGWWGKCLTFLVGLVCTCLPITGFIIWYGRRKKNKKTNA